jgi:PhzF family phenazine biosynthesis protein
MQSYRFVLADVFAEQPLTGNQLPVVLHAEGLTGQQMQAIAREFNHSETTFILPPQQAKADWRLRCFSPAAEVFGAGHNSLGAWWVIAELGLVNTTDAFKTFWQELGEQTLPVGIYCEAGRPLRVALTQSEPRFGDKVSDITELARALGLTAADLAVDGLEAQAVSTGAMHLLVPVSSLSALERIRVEPKTLIDFARPLECHGCYVFCLDTTEPGVMARTRGFFPGIGISEDPATGSAAGPLAAYLASRNLIAEGVWNVIEQGVEMGRRSRLEVRLLNNTVEVAGQSVIVGEGTISV